MFDRDYYLTKKNGKKLYVNILENDPSSPNVIFIQTPVCSVIELKETYRSLSKFGLNVFALDLFGSGQSEGTLKDLSIKTVHEDLAICIDYITNNYNDVIHVYAGSGMGGMLAQHYLSQKTPIKSFVQYGVAIYRDISIFKYPTLIKSCYPLIILLANLFPTLKIKFEKIADFKDYQGKNAAQEKSWYQAKMDEFPGAFDLQMSFLKTYLQMFLGNKSLLQNKPQCPVLVVAPKYDRFTPFSYFQRYFNWLEKPKELFLVEDSHLSFIWRAEEICKVASKWFLKHS